MTQQDHPMPSDHDIDAAMQHAREFMVKMAEIPPEQRRPVTNPKFYGAIGDVESSDGAIPHLTPVELDATATAWIGSRLDEATVGVGTHSEHQLIVAADVALAAPCSRVLEVRIGRGPMLAYGLLGATYQPSAGDGLVVTTIAGSPGPSHRRENAPASEVTRVGLPEEYRSAIIDGVSAAPALCPGRLSFDQAIIGEVGSSPRLFRQLATAVTSLIFGRDPDLAGMLRRTFDLN